MKKWVIGSLLLMSFVFSQNASADHRFNRGGFNDFGHNRHYSRNFNRNFYGSRVNPYHFGNNWRGGNFVSVSYGNRWGGNRWGGNNWRGNNWYNNGWGRRGGGDFVGGLVLGSLLNTPRIVQPRTERVIYRSAPVRQTQTVATTRRIGAVQTSTPRRRLLRDLSGDCFEVVISSNGDEIRSQLDPRECQF